MYDTYIVFLQDNTETINSFSSTVSQNYECVQGILNHLSGWKGGRQAPSLSSVITLCKLKKLYNERMHRNHSKFQLLQILVVRLISEMKSHDEAYITPVATTNHAQILFPLNVSTVIIKPVANAITAARTTITKPVVDATNATGTAIARVVVANPPKSVIQSVKRKSPLVGTKTFKSVAAYHSFFRVGQHPMFATPCVCVKKINWNQELVFEEWKLHDDGTRFNSKTAVYMCRRRRRDYSTRVKQLRQSSAQPVNSASENSSETDSPKVIKTRKKGIFDLNKTFTRHAHNARHAQGIHFNETFTRHSLQRDIYKAFTFTRHSQGIHTVRDIHKTFI